jgi:hypothetical protein
MEIPCDTIGQAVAGYLDAGDFTVSSRTTTRREPWEATHMTCSAIADVVVLGVVYELPTMPSSPAAANLACGPPVTAQALVSQESGLA